MTDIIDGSVNGGNQLVYFTTHKYQWVSNVDSVDLYL